MEASNDQLVLISGESATGKSASLRNIRNQEKWMYLNCESGKKLPFRNKFDTYKVTDPYQVTEGFDAVQDSPKWDGIIIDTLTFLMDMFESIYVLGSANTMKAWGDYNQFFKILMQDKVAKLGKPVIIMAHTRADYDETTMSFKTGVPVKGALKNTGIEAYFSTVVSTKKVPITELDKYKSDLLTVTDEDKELGYKYVYQTRYTKQTVNERIRSPMGLFDKSQTYMDNDAQLLLDHLQKYYHG